MDKISHISTSFLLVFILNLFLPLWLSSYITLLIGFIKESRDIKFDKWDILSNIIGIILAIIFKNI